MPRSIAIPIPPPLLVSYVEDMRLPGRLALAAIGAVVVSVGLAAAYRAAEMHIMREYTGGFPAETEARILAEEIEDAKHDAMKFASVLVPLTVAGVSWREKRKELKA